MVIAIGNNLGLNAPVVKAGVGLHIPDSSSPASPSVGITFVKTGFLIVMRACAELQITRQTATIHIGVRQGLHAACQSCE
jgi:hypothetical protein